MAKNLFTSYSSYALCLCKPIQGLKGILHFLKFLLKNTKNPINLYSALRTPFNRGFLFGFVGVQPIGKYLFLKKALNCDLRVFLSLAVKPILANILRGLNANTAIRV